MRIPVALLALPGASGIQASEVIRGLRGAAGGVGGTLGGEGGRGSRVPTGGLKVSHVTPQSNVVPPGMGLKEGAEGHVVPATMTS